MFKFSLEWLLAHTSKNMTFDEVIKKLRLQGFEFQGSQNIDGDIVTAIEVKANRPDMLSHMGIVREIEAFDGNKIPKLPEPTITADNSSFPIKIDVNKEICKRFCALKINGIDASVSTPEYIKKRLNALSINSVNVVVDIGNYVMLDMGQPVHCYDADKISGNKLFVSKAKAEEHITTFAGENVAIKPGDIIISDDENIQCVAGIIGSNASAVTQQSKNIILEAAVFDEVSVRLTSRRIKVSTPSSFRFERGVNAYATLGVLCKYAQMLTEICGGKIEGSAFDFRREEMEDKFLSLSVKNTCSLLGISLSADDILSYLEKYDFSCQLKNDDVINVKIPSYRLDVKQEVDLIEEVARIHGYDNIAPVMPTIMTSYEKNAVWSNSDIIRNVFSGLGFNETINYSFIPADTMKNFGIKPSESLYSELTIQNPIAGAYALMRPFMVYSLLNCLAYNYSIGNSNLALFELGRVYFKDEKTDTGCREVNTCGFIMSGTKIGKGFGVDKDIKYTYYDLLSYLKILMGKFGQTFELQKNDYAFFEKGSGYSIMVNGESVGFIGELNKSMLGKLQNVKLIRDKIFYGEFNIEKISENTKKIAFESKYPTVKRQYNLVQNKGITAGEVIDSIKSVDSVIRSVIVKDVYSDKTFENENHAILYEVNYCSKTATLTSEEIEKIESVFLKNLAAKFGIQFKS